MTLQRLLPLLALFALHACGLPDADMDASIDSAFDGDDGPQFTGLAPSSVSAPLSAAETLTTAPIIDVNFTLPSTTRANLREPQHVATSSSSPPVPPEAATASVDSTGEAWFGVAASPVRPGALAVWNHEHVERSLDDGRSWHALSIAGPIEDVAIDDDGTIAVAGRATLAFVSPDGVVRTRRAPSHESVRIAVRGGLVAWHSQQGLFVSRDGGATFHEIEDAEAGNYDNAVRIARDGSIWTYAHSEAACGGGFERVMRAEPHAHHADDRSPAWWGLMLGANGLVLGIDEDASHRLHVAAHDPESGTDRRLLDVRDGFVPIAANRTLTLLQPDHRIVSVTSRHATTLATSVPDGFLLAAVDTRGRAMGIEGGGVMRLEGDERWRVLH